MRVTDQTKQNSILRNISYNQERLQDLQTGMATGKRINKLSDDPVAATQVQDYRTGISYIEATKKNIQTNFVWLDRYEAEMTHMGELLTTAKNLVLAQANDSADASTRRLTAKEIDALTKGLMSAGNAQSGKLFIFSGTQTFTRPLEVSERTQPAQVTQETPEGPENPAQVEGTFEGFSNNSYLVRVAKAGPLGQATVEVSDDEGETWSREKQLLSTVEVVNEKGKLSDKVRLHVKAPKADEEGNPYQVPAGLVFRFEPNPAVRYMGNEEKRMVPIGEGALTPLNITAKDVFFPSARIPGSVDIFGMLSTISQALDDNDGETLRARLEQLDNALEQVLIRRAEIGGSRKELETQLERLSGQAYSKTEQMSGLEDLDFAEATVEANLAEVRHKASLETSSRLISPSLLNFLR